MNETTMSTRKKASEATSNLRVAIRVRPMNGTERSEKCTNIARVDKGKLTVDLKNKPFGPFFRVYDSDTTQAEIYSDLVSSQIKKVIAGFNCTVFAYGQTGTGKTFTMEGGRTDAKSSSDDPTTGIIPRAVEDIFEQLEASGCEEYSLRVSYVELYNEELFDLLASSDNEDRERLRIFDDPNKKGVIVSGVEEVPVRNRSDVFKLLQSGAEKRRTAATLMNMHSSRSHSLFMVNVVVRENTNTGEELVKQGKLNLVDLAGSENIGRSGAQGNRAKEAGSINQSLLTLGRVIRSLTTNAQHVPYRESKLTRLLQDSLGGSTITSLIATMSPSSSNFEESQSTLEYAMRAANIKNKPVCNTKVSKKTILKEYSDEIEKLRRDLRAAREKNGVIISEESHEEFQKNTEKCRELEEQLDFHVGQLKNFAEDFMHMDEQYKKLYDRKDQLEDRLRERLREMAEKEKELAETTEKLDKHVIAISLMHTAALKSYDQLLQSRDAAGELVTDVGAFWKKVDEMGRADGRNKEMVEKFLEQMNQFIEKTSKQTESVKNGMTVECESLVKEMAPSLQSIDSISQEIEKNSEEINSVMSTTFQKATAIEKAAAEKLSSITEENCEKWDSVLKACTDLHKEHSIRADEFNKQLMERLDEIKKQVSDFTEDIRPLLTEIRNTTSDAMEKRIEESNGNMEEMKTTCTSMAQSLKSLLAQVEQLSVKSEKNHEKQMLADQSAQESVLSSLNTAETVVQSLEDIVEEQCDIKEINEQTQGDLERIDLDYETTVQEAKEKAVEKETEAKGVLNTQSEESERNRKEAREGISGILEKCSANSEKCRLTGKEVHEKCDESTKKMISLITEHEGTIESLTSAASSEVSKVCLEFVDPAKNVPPRVIPTFPNMVDISPPPQPETLLDEEEEIGNEDGELAKKKRRVTSFVRRDSLLDATNVFLSPTSIRNKREQTIDEDEEDIEN